MRSPRGSEEDEALVKKMGEEVNQFVKGRWKESEWETAWFVNPPVRVFWIKWVIVLK